jgi:membrane fusion protein
MNLFRKQVTNKLRQQSWGEVNISQPASFRIVFWIFLLLSASCITFLIFAKFNKTETVFGVIKPDVAITKNVSPITGTVSKILVDEGQFVTSQQPLFIVTNTDKNALGIKTSETLINQLSSQAKILKQLVDSAEGSKLVEFKQLEIEYRNTEGDLQIANAQLENLMQQLTVAETQLNAQLELHNKNLLSLNLLNTAQTKVLNIEQAILERVASKARYGSILNNYESQRAQTETKYFTTVADLKLQLSNLELQILQRQSQSGAVIYAKSSGTFSNIAVRVGQQVNANQYLSRIVPANAKFIAHLFLPSKSIGFINERADTKLKIDAFPFQQYGTINATLHSISADLMMANELPDVMPRLLNQAFYQAKATLNRKQQNLIKLAHNEFSTTDLPLRSGMTLSAEIIISRRSLLEWLFAPLVGAVR